MQKGCQLLADIHVRCGLRYWEAGLQMVFVASGAFEKHFHDIVRFHSLGKRVAVCGFNENLSHQAFAAADFILMPSSFEPCGLPQMIGGIYGTLPIVFDTGGLHDTVRPLDVETSPATGFIQRP